MARRQFRIHLSVGTDPDKKGPTLPRDRPTSKDTSNSKGYEYSVPMYSYRYEY
eukprot:COSAG01_NODE_1180_length_11360_cov_40.643460_14_plen_53_part_00